MRQKTRKTIEIINNLESRYNQANNCEKSHILKLLGVNYILDGKSVKAVYRQPFNYFADIKKSIDYTQKEKSQNLLENQDFEAFIFIV